MFLGGLKIINNNMIKIITNIKFILRLILPPFLLIFYKKIRGEKNHNTYEGIYKNFEDVPIVTSYINENTQNDIHNELAALIMDFEENAYHPEAQIRSQITNLLPLLLALIDKEKISILDFGGSAGQTYIDCISKLRSKKNIDYYIYDLEETMKIGREVLSDFNHECSNINFITNISEIKSFDIVYFGSSLQYVSDYKSILLSVITKEPDYIFLTDNYMNKHSTYVTTQVNMPGRKMSCWIFEFDEIVSFLSKNNYSLIYSSSNFQPFHNFNNFPQKNKVVDTSNLLFKKIRIKDVER